MIRVMPGRAARRASLLSVALLAAAANSMLSCGGPTRPVDEQIDVIFQSAHDGGEFNGSVLVTRGDKTIYEKSFGLANAEENIANQNGTRYLAYSVVKPMTAVLIFQQIEAGELRSTDKLEALFPNLSSKPAGPITLQQLLTHTSGINEFHSDHLDRRITPKDIELAKVTPTAEFDYSSAGYIVLGLVLEQSTGRSYEGLIQEMIFDPAGMRDSGLVRGGRKIPGLARGYRIAGDGLAPADPGINLEILDGAGSLYTTARDLWRFDRALADGKLIFKETQGVMLSQEVEGRYGYGWFLSEQGGDYFPWHSGGFDGYASVLVRQVHRQEVIVILSNLEGADVLGLRTEALRALKSDPSF